MGMWDGGGQARGVQLQHLVALSDVPQCLFGALSSVLCRHGFLFLGGMRRIS